jgi:hypothetical protein
MQAEEAMNDLSTGAEGVHSDAITDLEDANLPPVPPVTALLKGKQLEFTPGTPGETVSTWGTGGKTSV